MVAVTEQDSRFRLSEATARDLAGKFGTPLYVLDEAHLRARIRQYLAAFKACYPDSELSFASKANSTLAVLAIAHQEGCEIDTASEGELRAAMAAGVPASDCRLHGNNKSVAELEFALIQGIGHVIIDNFDEIENLVALKAKIAANTRMQLRLAPGVDPITHDKIATGKTDTKFGFNIADGSAEKALVRCLEAGLPVIGFHCHVGSQLLDPEAQRVGGEALAQFAVAMRERHDFETTYLNLGGGLGVKYLQSDEPMAVEQYCDLVVKSLLKVLEGTGLTPTLGQEPGRSIVAESGVTLYRVGVLKTVPSPTRGSRTYLGVDGGLSDNPRPALYGSRYEVERIGGGQPTYQVTVSGKHCETDQLFEDVLVPAETKPGDLLQVLTTGAYNSTMASNYNRFPRPATILIREDGSFALVQRREGWEEMLARENVPEDLVRR